MEDASECMLVLIGATPEGRKELIGFHVGVRESSQSWRKLLVNLKARGLANVPEIAVGDGALGFLKAIDQVRRTTKHQRCWLHKAVDVLNKVAKSVRPRMKKNLAEVLMSPDRASVETAIAVLDEKYSAKYPKALECLTKDRTALLAFYDYPAKYWVHLRTTNPIESAFSTVRHRTFRTKGSLSPGTTRLMVFKLVMAAARTWRKLKGENQLPKVIRGAKFTDGTEIKSATEFTAA